VLCLIADLLCHCVQESSAEGPLPEPAALLPGGNADDQGGAGERAEPGAARHPLHQGPVILTKFHDSDVCHKILEGQ
jgi:hypothetical protein